MVFLDGNSIKTRKKKRLKVLRLFRFNFKFSTIYFINIKKKLFNFYVRQNLFKKVLGFVKTRII
jgi:hypothetical protein